MDQSLLTDFEIGQVMSQCEIQSQNTFHKHFDVMHLKNQDSIRLLLEKTSLEH